MAHLTDMPPLRAATRLWSDWPGIGGSVYEWAALLHRIRKGRERIYYGGAARIEGEVTVYT